MYYPTIINYVIFNVKVALPFALLDNDEPVYRWGQIYSGRSWVKENDPKAQRSGWSQVDGLKMENGQSEKTKLDGHQV